MNVPKHAPYCRFAVGVLSLFVCLDTSAASTEEAPPDRRIIYKKVGDVELKLHVFEPLNHREADEQAAIVFFFGGGWVGGSPQQFYPHCRLLAENGMVAMAAEYRVKRRHGTSPYECVADGKSAVRFIRRNAKELGVDPSRIVAAGGSAGGHVAACTGTIKKFDEPEEDENISSRPDAMVLFNPVIDTGPGGYGHNRLGDRYREISPLEHVSANTPPTMIFHGTADTTTPIAGIRTFRDRMTKAGNTCQLEEFQGAGHGFFNFGRGNGNAYRETTAKMIAFLKSLGYLPQR